MSDPADMGLYHLGLPACFAQIKTAGCAVCPLSTTPCFKGGSASRGIHLALILGVIF